MRGEPMSQVLIFNVKKKTRGETTRYHVRSRVHGFDFTRSFKERGEAYRYHDEMIAAKVAGLEFDRRTGRPVENGAKDTSFATFATDFINLKRLSLQDSALESVQKALALSVSNLLAKPLPKTLEPYASEAVRKYILVETPGSTVGEVEDARTWILKHSLCLSEIDAVIATKLLGRLNTKEDKKTKVSPNTFRRRRQAVFATLEHAVALDILKKNPIGGAAFTLPKTESTIDVEDLPTVKEVRVLCQSLNDGTPRGRSAEVFASIMWLAGLRPGECLGLKVKSFRKNRRGEYELALTDNVVQVSKAFASSGIAQTTKQLKSRAVRHVRRVPIPKELADVLVTFVEDKDAEELLFPSTRHGGALTLSVFEDRWNKVCGGRWRLYDLRHLNASILIYSGLNIIEVAKRLGHSIQVCSTVYLHAIESLSTSPTTKINKFLRDQ
jgi:integrase